MVIHRVPLGNPTPRFFRQRDAGEFVSCNQRGRVAGPTMETGAEFDGPIPNLRKPICTCVSRYVKICLGASPHLIRRQRGGRDRALARDCSEGEEDRDYQSFSIEPDGLKIRHGSRTDKIPLSACRVNYGRRSTATFARLSAMWSGGVKSRTTRRRSGANSQLVTTRAEAPTAGRLAIERVFVKPVFVYPSDVRPEPGGKRDMLEAHVRSPSPVSDDARRRRHVGGTGGPAVFRHPQKRADFKTMPHVAGM